jgi:GT2 family glycosyltransferase/glycosyltransferase involved in cell wall biosynthesis
VSARGVVLFHDTNVREHGFGVNAFWREVQTRYPHFEFAHGHGLGLLAVGAEIAPDLQGLFEASPAEAAAVRNFFYLMGNRFSKVVEHQQYLNEQVEKQVQDLQSLNEDVVMKEQALQMLSAQVAIKESQIERITASLSWRLRTRALAAYMKVPYPLRRIMTGSARRLLSLGKSGGSPQSNSISTEAKKKVTTEAGAADQAAVADAPAQGENTIIDVIVPVYRGVEETIACLNSVLRSTPATAYELIVINDASPEPALVERLEELAAEKKFTLLHNEENLGFVLTVNRGMRLHPQRDVILLNSDTEVNGDWLDRLRRAAHSAGDIGTVTPFSNSATICSYPVAFQDNPLPADADLAKLDRLCAALNARQTVGLPTAVGFCMYIRRDCLSEVGYFNEKNFGKGYGEENDFCMRGMRRGWRHVLAADTFVYHAGSVSFGTGNDELKSKATEVISKLHPNYHYLVQQHIAANPARHLRWNLDVGRLAGPRKTILFVIHNLGGGVQRHVTDLAARLMEEGVRPITLKPVDNLEHLPLVRLEHPTISPLPHLVFNLETEYAELLTTLKALNISHVHFHSTVGLPAKVLDIPENLRATYDVTVHDYHAACPRITFLDGKGQYCKEPADTEVCNACINKDGYFMGSFSTPKRDVVTWRAAHAAWFDSARKVYVPHADVGTRLNRYFPQLRWEERRHLDSHPAARLVASPLAPDQPLRVAVVGALGIHKGNEVILACAKDALARNLPIMFYITGGVHAAENFFPLNNVRLSGEYKEEKIYDMLEAQRCHCALFASIIPETYSYTLSITLAGGLFPLALDLGAVGARIRELGWGQVIPLDATPAQINDCLMALTPEQLANGRPVVKPIAYESIYGHYYEFPDAQALAAYSSGRQ